MRHKTPNKALNLGRGRTPPEFSTFNLRIVDIFGTGIKKKQISKF